MPVPPLGHDPVATPVAVVYGGPSAEHDVSIVSGTAIADALRASCYPMEQWLIDLDGGWWRLPAEHRRDGRPQAAYGKPPRWAPRAPRRATRWTG
jgi:D-alanine-D-alanine ligase-like ATP-grasp enzyme